MARHHHDRAGPGCLPWPRNRICPLGSGARRKGARDDAGGAPSEASSFPAVDAVGAPRPGCRVRAGGRCADASTVRLAGGARRPGVAGPAAHGCRRAGRGPDLRLPLVVGGGPGLGGRRGGGARVARCHGRCAGTRRRSRAGRRRSDADRRRPPWHKGRARRLGLVADARRRGCTRPRPRATCGERGTAAGRPPGPTTSTPRPTSSRRSRASCSGPSPSPGRCPTVRRRRTATSSFRTYPGRDHVPLVQDDSPLIPEILAWTQDRFDGEPPTPTCT